MIIRLVAIIVLLIFSYTESKKFIQKKAVELKRENIRKELILKTGDIIVKKEDNPQSEFLSQIDESKFSDIGVVLKIDSQYYVANYDLKETGELLEIVALKKYVYFATNLSVYRYEKQIDDSKLFTYLEEIKNSKIKYDYFWNLDSKELYNTKFINSIFQNLYDENLYKYIYNFYGLNIISIKSILENEKLNKQFELDFTDLERLIF
ncbi:hypothetical protein [Aliarcobacter thereius]|uniref:Uncharacterized protein n=1 Tax=Aliarcobacter thereius LMG 24486 TaxID=1032240 RepID=A0A1C7WR62_9BACT|nr:hypothetical protein [Aliarcobacter thereius]OCL90921.1 hypothetical protein AAX25_01089 [Aliarcobacter thereius]OCL96250.1 hypothetical protein AA347_01741 [Aliarcobacter thereius LMG 24486]QBF15785.1 permuted papain-like amidase enzyme, YaeF/YiiX, C92 family [Aliarcobacter thereius LMG 24486]